MFVSGDIDQKDIIFCVREGMGNHSSHGHNGHSQRKGSESSMDTPGSSAFSGRTGSKKNSACLIKLFQKLELTADENNHHPGELTRTTFENAFHGPLHTFGKLLYKQMCSFHGTSDRERITKEQFVKSGKELLKMFDEPSQHKYYFKLFCDGKDYLNKEDGLQMVNVSYCLTLGSSSIKYTKSVNDDKVFESIVHGMFGPHEELCYDDFKKWTNHNLPHIYCGVHNWVYTILTGSKMPSEQETAPVPELEKFEQDKHCMSMGMVWALSAVIPASYTHIDQKEEQSEFKNPLLTSFNLLMKIARLSRCQSWTSLYNSSEHGLSLNRFTNHVVSYHGPTITLLSFEGRNIYCIAEDAGWREGTHRFGGEDTMLLQITPVFRVVQAGGPMVLWNEYSRDIRQGIHIGKDPKSLIIVIPSDFDKVEHYGVNCAINKLEVWGCGSTTTKDKQNEQKQWEKKETEKHKQRKLKLEQDWDENPDKQILNWGGIKTEHQYSQGGNF